VLADDLLHAAHEAQVVVVPPREGKRAQPSERGVDAGGGHGRAQLTQPTDRRGGGEEHEAVEHLELEAGEPLQRAKHADAHGSPRGQHGDVAGHRGGEVGPLGEQHSERLVAARAQVGGQAQGHGATSTPRRYGRAPVPTLPVSRATLGG